TNRFAIGADCVIDSAGGNLWLRYDATSSRWFAASYKFASAGLTNSQLAVMAAFTTKGNPTSGSATPVDMTQVQLATQVNVGPVTPAQITADQNDYNPTNA